MHAQRHITATRLPLAFLLLLLVAGCGSSVYLDRVLEPRAGDHLQHGGNAGRTNVISRADERLHARGQEGLEVAWDFSLHGAADRATALYVDETVLFPSTTGRIEMVDLHRGNQIGRISAPGFIQSTPAVTGTSLFIAISGRDPLLLCYDLERRQLLYQRSIPSVQAALCAAGDRVVYAAGNGQVACHSPDDSTARWTVSLDDRLTASPAASDSVVVVAGQNGDLNAFAISDGRHLWRVPTGAAFLAGPSVLADAVLAVNVEGGMIMTELDSGRVRWRRDLGAPVYQEAAWRADTVVVALANGDILLLHARDGRELERFRTGELPGAAPQFFNEGILLLQRKGSLLYIDLPGGDMQRIAELPARSRTAPLVTPNGIVLVDEKGEAVCMR